MGSIAGPDISTEKVRFVIVKAREVRDLREMHAVAYLLGTPLRADYLEEGLSQFGLSCEDFELGRL